MLQPDGFPTFRRAMNWTVRAAHSPWASALRAPGLALGGIGLVVLCEWLNDSWVPIGLQMHPWYLYAFGLSGFAGAAIGAWGLRHDAGGVAYGIVLGMLFGARLFLDHPVIALSSDRYGNLGDIRIGSRGAGLSFFALSALGGAFGTWLAGCQLRWLLGRLTRRRALVWAIAILLVSGVWVGLFYVSQTQLIDY